MKIHIFNDQSDLPLAPEATTAVVREVLSLENVKSDEVNCYFVSTEEITRLHAEFFNDPTPTDCISFPIDEPSEPGLFGEVFVCPKTAIEYAKVHGEKVYEETTLYLVHGLLHLVGYDDIAEADLVAMRVAEKKHMTNLRHLGMILSK